MARNCSSFARDQDIGAGFVDLGIGPGESHTKFSTNPDTVVNAFIDFLYMVDAAVVVSTGSSFSLAVAEIKGYRVLKVAERDSIEMVESLYLCIPRYC